MNNFKFTNKRALVTGASSGIGKEIARQLHKEGCSLLITSRRKNLLDELANELNSVRENSVEVFPCDLTDDENLKALEAKIIQEDFDILVSNAGFGSFGLYDELDYDHEERMIKLNIIAGAKLCHAITPKLKEKKDGAIVIISSIAGFQPLPYMATYAATKAFNLSHAMALYEELKPFSIRVLGVCPGPVNTEFSGVARVPGKPTNITRDEPEDIAKEVVATLRKDKSWFVPGKRGFFLSLPSRILPKSLTTKLVGKSLLSSL